MLDLEYSPDLEAWHRNCAEHLECRNFILTRNMPEPAIYHIIIIKETTLNSRHMLGLLLDFGRICVADFIFK